MFFLIFVALTLAMAVEEMFLSTSDGVTLSIRKWTGSKDTDVVVIFIHQYAVMGGQGQLMEGMARRVARQGFDSLTFDLRGAGRSSGKSSWTNQNELVDVRTVIDYAIQSTHKKIFVVGSSGGAPLAGAVLDHSDRIIGGLFVGYVWGFWASILFGWAYKSIEISTKPKLFVVGTRDEFTSMSQYQDRLARLAGNLNEMRIIDGKNHFEIEASVYDQQVAEWITDFLLKISLQCRRVES
jgi:uncharacterized protein